MLFKHMWERTGQWTLSSAPSERQNFAVHSKAVQQQVSGDMSCNAIGQGKGVKNLLLAIAERSRAGRGVEGGGSVELEELRLSPDALGGWCVAGARCGSYAMSWSVGSQGHVLSGS